MIFVAIRADVRQDKRDDWLAGIVRYSSEVRQEPGNLTFTCFESVEHPNQFAILASYADQDAGAAHVASDHARWFFDWLPSVVVDVPKIVYQELPGEGWSEMGEVEMDGRSPG